MAWRLHATGVPEVRGGRPPSAWRRSSYSRRIRTVGIPRRWNPRTPRRVIAPRGRNLNAGKGFRIFPGAGRRPPRSIRKSPLF